LILDGASLTNGYAGPQTNAINLTSTWEIINNVQDLLSDPQLAASNFWYSLEHQQTGPLAYPLGVFDSDEVTPRTISAPILGGDNVSIYIEEMDLTKEDLETLKENGVI